MQCLATIKIIVASWNIPPVALEKEPGMQAAYFWTVKAADGIGNSIGKAKALEAAKEALTGEEYEKLILLLKTAK